MVKIMKTLNVMNVKEDDVLNRNEMKAIMAGSGSGPDTCSCTYNGCHVTLHQGASGWVLHTCDGTWTGSGTYGGTVCGGQCP